VKYLHSFRNCKHFITAQYANTLGLSEHLPFVLEEHKIVAQFTWSIMYDFGSQEYGTQSFKWCCHCLQHSTAPALLFHPTTVSPPSQHLRVAEVPSTQPDTQIIIYAHLVIHMFPLYTTSYGLTSILQAFLTTVPHI
jgi:hypothetical protein